jgi:tetrahydromethanopterin S-methyltransferase subunit F
MNPRLRRGLIAGFGGLAFGVVMWILLSVSFG